MFFDQLKAGDYISREEAMVMNQILRFNAGKLSFNEMSRQAQDRFQVEKGAVQKGDVGYPEPTYASAGTIAPLVPQSIQSTLDTATFTMNHLKFYKEIPKASATSTIHEGNIEDEPGSMAADPFIAEGQLGPESEATYRRQQLQIKYLGEYIKLSDVSTMVGVTGFGGIDKGALATRTLSGTKALLGKLESALFHADSDLSPLQFDGLFKQIAAEQIFDLAGGQMLLQDLVRHVHELASGPYFGEPNFMCSDPKTIAFLNNQAVQFGKHDQMSTADGKIMLRAKQLVVDGPYGPVPLSSIPLMGDPAELRGPNLVAVGGSNAPTLGARVVTVNPAGVSGSLWTPAWAGTVKYAVQAHGDGGVSVRALVTGTQDIVATGSFELDIDDTASPTEGDESVRYYKLFRSMTNDPTGTLYYVGSFPRNTDASSGGTLIEDKNENLPNHGSIVFGQLDKETIQFVQLLDFMRRPLASTLPNMPFILMLFGSLWLKANKKFRLLKNVPRS